MAYTYSGCTDNDYQMEIERLEAELAECRRQRDGLAKIVRRNEWVELHNWADPESPMTECLSCGRLQWKGHTEDCPHQAALASMQDDGFPE